MTARLARFFHRTTAARARAILRGGFKDSVGQFLADTEHAGVWLSDRPLDENEGARGDALLVVEIAADLVERYEWIEHGKPYREFLVPAAMLNEHGTVAPADDEASGPIA